MKVKNANRLYWVDALKAIGIFFVVFGHTVGIEARVRDYIFSFHMPLFFFISGFLLKKKHLEMPYVSFLIKKGKELLTPYFVFGFLSYLFWVTLLRHYGMHASLIHVEPLHPLIGVLYGIGVGH
ncbi:MAG TPA: acyltransferase family protein, partial [Thermodesulfovibrionia bacterium]|nr:acyltransferase family protein [Thermodesulfovibrionia bacterium]